MLIEAAIVMPLIITLVMGIIDFGMVFSDMQTVGSASRQGARSGVAYSRQLNYESQVTAAVAAALQARTTGTPLELWIYQVDPSTTESRKRGSPIDHPDFGDCTTKCSKYTWNGSGWTAAGGAGWAWHTMNACTGDLDIMGVRVKVRHDLVTGLFGDSVTLTDKTIMRLEPQPLSSCA